MKKLFVGNLSFGSREDDIRSLFQQYGAVNQVQLMTDRDTGQSRGFAFVEMPVDTEAEAGSGKQGRTGGLHPSGETR